MRTVILSARSRSRRNKTSIAQGSGLPKRISISNPPSPFVRVGHYESSFTKTSFSGPSKDREHTMPELKLSKLPDRVPVKLSVSVSPELNRRLQSYAALYKKTYGEEE